ASSFAASSRTTSWSIPLRFRSNSISSLSFSASNRSESSKTLKVTMLPEGRSYSIAKIIGSVLFAFLPKRQRCRRIRLCGFVSPAILVESVPVNPFRVCPQPVFLMLRRSPPGQIDLQEILEFHRRRHRTLWSDPTRRTISQSAPPIGAVTSSELGSRSAFQKSGRQCGRPGSRSWDSLGGLLRTLQGKRRVMMPQPALAQHCRLRLTCTRRYPEFDSVGCSRDVASHLSSLWT